MRRFGTQIADNPLRGHWCQSFEIITRGSGWWEFQFLRNCFTPLNQTLEVRSSWLGTHETEFRFEAESNKSVTDRV